MESYKTKKKTVIGTLVCLLILASGSDSLYAQQSAVGSQSSVAALPAPYKTTSYAIIPYKEATTPYFSHGYLIQFNHQTPFAGASNIYLFNTNGQLEHEIAIWPKAATKLFLTAVDIGSDGRLAFAGEMTKGDGSDSLFVATSDLGGSNPTYFSTGDYRASQIAVADDGSIWAIGAERGTTNGNITTWSNYNMLRHFSPSGTLVDQYLPRFEPVVAKVVMSKDPNGEVQRQAYNAAGAPVSTTTEERQRGNAASWGTARRVFLRSAGSATVYYDGIQDKVCRYDARGTPAFSCKKVTGSNAEQFSLPTGLAINSSGNVYASLRNGNNEASSVRGLFVLAPSADNQALQWYSVTGEESSGLQNGDFLSLLGGDGSSLAFRRVVPRGAELAVTYVSAP